MITFRELQSEDFPDYRSIFIRDYCEDLSINHGHTIEESLEIAENIFVTSFPNNAPISSDKIVSILTGSSPLGYLWYSIDKGSAKAYICDFVIFEKYRSQGYGKSAIKLLESELSKQRINYLGLRVASNNPRALELYESFGFNISGYNMCKRVI